MRTIRELESGRVGRPHADTVRLLADALELDDAGRTALRQATAAPAPCSLSAQVVGRRDELALADRLLRGGEARLLTLTGPPGVGKTRLALTLTASLGAALPDGAALVDLAPLTEPGQVAPAIRRALGRDRDAASRPIEQVAAQIGRRRLLVTLDNFEHLLPAASLLPELLERCPEVRVLVTSRAALGLRDEQELPVAPLPLPDAVTLFVRRVQQRAPAFALTDENEAAVAEVCRRLDCLPLALELVAPWLRLMTPEALLVRLRDGLQLLINGARDLPERHRTMRAALSWSYELLGTRERALFRTLSAFAGGATLDALEAVCQSSPGGLLPVLGGLADGNLVRPEGEGAELRVGMLETVRQYGRELLAAAGESARVTEAHARYYAALVERRPEASEQGTWIERLEPDLDNLRAALAWLRAACQTELGLRTAALMLPLWERHGALREGIRWLDGWTGPGREVPAPLRAQALHARSVLSFRLGDHVAAREDAEASLALHREQEDGAGCAAALNYLAGIEFEQGQVERAIELCTESLSLRRRTGDPYDVACSLRNLAMLMMERGDGHGDRRAAELCEEAVAICRRSGDLGSVLPWSLNALAILALAAGCLVDARAYLDECVAALPDGRYPTLMADVHNARGHLARAEGDAAAARASYAAGLAMRLPLRHRALAAYDLQGLAAVDWMEGRSERAAVLYGAAARVQAASGHRPERHERERHAPILAEVREALGEERFQEAWATGMRLSVDEAAKRALDTAG